MGSQIGCGSIHGRLLERTQEDGLLQDRPGLEVEVEAQAGNARTEGGEPIHEGALCLQGQARVPDREGLRAEETQGRRELSRRRPGVAIGVVVRAVAGGLAGLASVYTAALE